MDDWIKFSVSEDVEWAKVKCPFCPTCGQMLRSCHRYSDCVKSYFEDLISIKVEYVMDDIQQKQLEKARAELTKLKPAMKDCGLEDAINSVLSDITTGRKSSLDERWDLYNRSFLAVYFCCFLVDVKKAYPYSDQKHL